MWIATLACITTSTIHSLAPADIPVEEITDPVTPPGPRVVDAAGERRIDADPHELRAGGDFYYRSGELARAREFYAACSGAAQGQLRAACQWAIGATLVAEARQLADEVQPREHELGVRRSDPLPLECTAAAYHFHTALAALRVAQRSHTTARRALVIGALYEELGSDVEALRFYAEGFAAHPDEPRLGSAADRLRARGPRPACPNCVLKRHRECRPRDCPELPFGWHRRTGELAVLGSGLEGSSRERALACFGEPSRYSRDTWSYTQSQCTATLARSEPRDGQSITTTVRLHFDDDVVDAVTHERIVEARACSLWVN